MFLTEPFPSFTPQVTVSSQTHLSAVPSNRHWVS